ncbi:protein AF-9 isoform X6 [Macrotis lagotis]|uniref:protein AF-9 isoform X6 n=1 Tax=Macrotis lagotis TaxID=92651 RepID=UPI003D69E1E8
MASSCAVQVKLELGHRAQVRKKPTVEGFTHDWMVFVRGPEHSNIQHFVEKVVFHLHESFPRPKRGNGMVRRVVGEAPFMLVFMEVIQGDILCKDPPYKVEESGYAGFILPIEVYFKNKDPNRSSHTNSSSTSGNSFSKPHKLSKEHKEKPPKDSREHKSAFKEPSREHNKSSKESSKKPKENKPLKEEKIVPKMAFKEPKPMSKEPKHESSLLTITGGQQQDKKAPSKRPPVSESEDLAAKKRKKSSSEALFKSFSSAPPLILTCSADKKPTKDKSHVKVGKVKMEGDTTEKKKSTLPPFDDIVDPNDSDMEENMSSKSEGHPADLSEDLENPDWKMRESEQPSPASSSSSSSSSFTPSQTRQQGPLRSIMKDLHSDDNEDESEEADENDNDSEMERPINTRGGSRSRRVSLSDGSDSESSSASSPLRHEPPPPLLKTNSNQILEVKSPIKQSKSDKQIKNGDCDKAYLDELVELHRRLMTLRERHVLQQIVNLIEETGHFHITNTTFDFDLCSLDKTTVRKLQSYLETSGTS